MAISGVDATIHNKNRPRLGPTAWIAIAALVTSSAVALLNTFFPFLYVRRELSVNIAHLFVDKHAQTISMCVAFANTGNKDAAIVRAHPLLWQSGKWTEIDAKEYESLTDPDTPVNVQAGGVRIMFVDALFDPSLLIAAGKGDPNGDAYLGVSLQTMNSEGDFFTTRYSVGRFHVRDDEIVEWSPLVDHSRKAFVDLDEVPNQIKPSKLRAAGEPIVEIY